MPATKRPADDAILPLRVPKQPKRTTTHPLGGNSSPSQYEALLARWSKVGMEFVALMKDTVLSVIGSGRDAPESLSVPPPTNNLPAANGHASGPIPSPSPSPPPAPPPRASTSAHRIPTRPRIPPFPTEPGTSSHTAIQLSTSAPAATETHRRIQSSQSNVDVSQPPIRLKYVPPRPNAVASTSKTTLPALEDPKVSGFPGGAQSTGLMSPPSTQASESSIRSAVTQKYPEVGAALQQERRRRKRSAKYIERPHIHAKEHKARVEAENRRMREEMERELYSLKRSRGKYKHY
ncbi:hypothetical protein BD310DRAFT_805286 [Dichomitus squalens]|uniref:Uncharacterized protein n=1 Tax=Dichomitus squalens TaxID=114155 RepID=A0A4Q9QCC6_9APHY|nr:hypothetical protein BD310DRAFT_805286 [Dichomitus squalens]